MVAPLTHAALLGVGGVGGYFGAKLCQLKSRASALHSLHVHFIARGEHLQAIRSRGLLLKAHGQPDLLAQPASATDQIRTLPPLDFCLICVKQFDLAPALHQLAHLVHGRTIILPLLNGVDVHSRIRQVITTGTVLPACVYIGTYIQSPGVIAQHGGACKIFLGPDPDHPADPPPHLCNLLTSADIKFEWKTSIQSDIWEKFIFISAFGLVTAAHDKTVGEVLEHPALTEQLLQVMNEVVALATALKIPLPPDIIQTSIAKGQSFPFDTKTSFQRDFERPDKPDERDLFASSILRLGVRLNIATPRTKALSEVLDQKKPAFWI